MRSRSIYDVRPPGFFGKRVARLGPGQGALHTMGWSFSVLGAPQTPAPTSASFREQMRRVRLKGANAPNATCGIHTATPVCWRGNADGYGGFCFSVRFALEMTLANMRAFIGLSALTTPVVTQAGEPSTIANSIGVGFDATDPSGGTWYLLRRDATNGTKTAISAASRIGNVYELTIWCAPNGASLHVRMVNLFTATTVLRDAVYPVPGDSSAGNVIPSATTLFAVHAELRASNSTQLGLDVISAALEVPDGALPPLAMLGRDGVYDVRDFGALGDGVTPDDNALADALAAMGPALSGIDREGTLYVSPGDFLLASDLVVERGLLMRGAGPGARALGSGGMGPSRLSFGALKGVRIMGLGTSPTGGAGDNAAIQDLGILCGGAVPMWTSGTNYAVGAKVLPRASRASVPESSWEYHFENLVAGIAATPEPNWGALAFEPYPATTVWQPTTNYTDAPVSLVRSSAANLSLFYACVAEGRSKPLPAPAWDPGPPGGETIDGLDVRWTTHSLTGRVISDAGAPRWAVRVAAGVHANTRFTLRRTSIRGAVNAAVHVQSIDRQWNGGTYDDPYASNANSSAIYDLVASNCGVGVLTKGDDANWGLVMNALLSTSSSDDKSEGVADRSFYGTNFVGCRIAWNAGPAIRITSAVASAAMLGASAPAQAGVSLNTAGQSWGFFGGDLQSGGGAGFTTDSFFNGARAADDWMLVWGRSTGSGGDTIEARLWVQPAVYLFQASTPDNYQLQYGAYDAGWWSVAHQDGWPAIAYAGGGAAPIGQIAPGTALCQRGVFVGSPKSIVASSLVEPDAGTGQQGDLVFNEAPAAGEPLFWQRTSTEWRPGPNLP